MDGDDRDPVQAGLGDEVDLYDVATWDVRTALDVLSLEVYTGLSRLRSWVLIVLALSLFLAELVFISLLVVESPSLGVLAVLSILPAFALVAYLWYDDPTRREPLVTLAVTFLLAVLFATFAALVNTSLLPVFQVSPLFGLPVFFFLVVGPIEETVKWLAVRVHAYKTGTFDAVVAGVVCGAVAGLGFAAIENMVYIVDTYLVAAEAGGATQFRTTIETATTRAFVGPGHVIYSAFAGYYLGLAKFNPAKRGPIVVKGLLLAVFIHALYNTLVSSLDLTTASFVALVVVYDGFWLGVLFRKLSRYRRYYEQAVDGATAAPPREG
jgi:RsiW-degrading membrane proteinase PrsW (M82 family)